MKNLLEESRESSTREQKLLSSALHDMGLELTRLKAPKPDLNLNSSTISNNVPKTAQQPKSLLGQKRQQLDKRL